jgi:hypothetical protein
MDRDKRGDAATGETRVLRPCLAVPPSPRPNGDEKAEPNRSDAPSPTET